MSAENWHEERDRLVKLVEGIESGEITHVDEGNAGQVLIETAAQRLNRLKRRVAELDTRLGPRSIAGNCAPGQA